MFFLMRGLLPPNLNAFIASNFGILSGSIHSIGGHRQPALYKQHGADTAGTNLKNLLERKRIYCRLH
ncbi:hypothetical protein P3S68_031376 [Capsicum galapagoense]